MGSAFGGLATLETQINELNTKGPSKAREADDVMKTYPHASRR